MPTNFNQNPPLDDRWELQGERHNIIWFDSPQLPVSLVTEEDESDQDISDDDVNVTSLDEDCLSSDEN